MSLIDTLVKFKTGFKAKAVEINGNLKILADAIDTKANASDVTTSVATLASSISSKANTTDVTTSISTLTSSITSTTNRVTALETTTGVAKLDGSGTFSAEQKGVDAVSNTAFTTLLQVKNMLPHKNFLINGDMRIAQRVPFGNAKALSTTAQFITDRFKVNASCVTMTAGNIQQAKSTNTFNYALNLSGVTYSGSGTLNGSSVSAYLLVEQRIESLNAYYLSGQKVSISADVYQDTGSNITALVKTYNPSTQDNYATTALNNTLTSGLSVPSGTKTRVKFEGLTLGDCSNGVSVGLILKTGDVTNKNFFISNIQVELGSKSTDFEYRPYELELASCMRYFEKSYPMQTLPTNTAVLASAPSYLSYTTSDFYDYGKFYFKVGKRVTPITLTIYNPFNGTTGTCSRSDGGTNPAVLTRDVSELGGSFYSSAGFVAATAYKIFWTADSEI